MWGLERRVGRRAAAAFAAWYLVRLGGLLVAALPLSLAVGSVVGSRPRGEGVLWDAGGVLLAETARLVAPRLGGVGLTTAGVWVAVLFASLLPLAALLAAMAGVRRSLLGRAGEAFGRFSLLLGLTILGQVLVIALGTTVGYLLALALGLAGTAQALCRGAGLGLGLCAAWLLGVIQDLTRVAVIARRTSLVGALGVSLRVLRLGPLRTLAACAWRHALAVGSLAAAAILGLANREVNGSVVAGTLGLHLAAVLAALYARASWLSWALRRTQLVRRGGGTDATPSP